MKEKTIILFFLESKCPSNPFKFRVHHPKDHDEEGADATFRKAGDFGKIKEILNKERTPITHCDLLKRTLSRYLYVPS